MINEITFEVNELVDQIDTSIVGTYDSETTQFVSCNTKWARVGKNVKDVDGNSYVITAVVTDEYVTLSPLGHENEPTNVVYLNDPFWITGTKLATNSEWSKAEKNLMKKTPLIWLLEVIRLRRYGRDSVIEFESDLRLFFLDETNVAQYYTADHRENVVYPMERLCDEFIKVVEANRNYQTIENYDIITFSRFGVERDNGMFQNVLDANLSGVELRITLTKYKENCKC
jgi:hypothetical protein